MTFAKLPIAGKLARNAKVAVFTAIQLLVVSCQNDNVGKLLRERASFERKKDSVEQAYEKRIVALKSEAQYQSFRLAPMIDELCRQREEAAKPFADSIDGANMRLREFDEFGKRIR